MGVVLCQFVGLFSDSNDYWLLFGCVQWDKLMCRYMFNVWIYVVKCKCNYVNYCTCLLMVDEMSSLKWELLVMHWIHDCLQSDVGLYSLYVIVIVWLFTAKSGDVLVVVLLSLHCYMTYIICCRCCERGESQVQMLELIVTP